MTSPRPQAPALRTPGLLPALALAAALGAAILGPLGASEPLPPGFEPLSAEEQARLEVLLDEAVRYRGLEAGDRVPAARQDRESLTRRIDEEIDDNLSARESAYIERVFDHFGFLPEGADFVPQFRGLLSAQIAGYFDPELDLLVMIDQDDGREAAEDGNPPEAGLPEIGESGLPPDLMGDMILVHELVHHLQHRHFDLTRALDDDEESSFHDALAARKALVEGDATLAMVSWLLGMPVERVPDAPAWLERMAEAAGSSGSPFGGEVPGQAELQGAPLFLRESLLFDYFGGARFVLEVLRAGGYPLLDHALENDLPRSSEQILHPEKWLGTGPEGRDDPVSLELPQLGGLFGGLEAFEGSWGELGIQLGLRQLLGEAGHDQAVRAAAGWGGDGFLYYGDPVGDAGDLEGLVWISEWDTEEDARELVEALEAAYGTDGTGPRIVQGESRVVVVYGLEDPMLLEAAVRASLAVPARRVDRPALDLAALGITEADRPPRVDQEALVDAFSRSPFAQAGGLDPEALAENPAFQRRAAEELEAFEVAAEGLELPELVISGMLHALPEVGLSFELGEEWVPIEEQAREEPFVLSMLQHGDGGILVLMALPQEGVSMPQAMIAGLRMSIPTYEERRFTDLERPDGSLARSFELAYDFDSDGVPIRSRHRFYQLPGWVVSLQVMTEESLWKGFLPEVDRLFESIVVEPVTPSVAESPEKR